VIWNFSFFPESPKQPHSCLRGRSSSPRDQPWGGRSPMGWPLFSKVAGSRAGKKKKKAKGKGKWRNRTWKGSTSSSPPQDVMRYLGQQMQISLRIKKQNIAHQLPTLTPVALKGQSHGAGTRKPTHALIQAARHSMHSVKQPATTRTQSSRFWAVRDHPLSFTTALRIYYCSKLYFGGKKTQNQTIWCILKTRPNSNRISPPETRKGHQQLI